MVRAILDGSKTQTRRVVKGANHISSGGAPLKFTGSDIKEVLCPYGWIGDRLWVRENFCPVYPQDPHYNGGRPIEYDYQATYKHGDRLGDLMGLKKKWRPSIHMPRAASRITLEVTGVRVERLQNISEADAIAEGIERCEDFFECKTWRVYGEPEGSDVVAPDDPVGSYRSLWESINGPDSWEANPWVWVVEFKRLKGGAA